MDPEDYCPADRANAEESIAIGYFLQSSTEQNGHCEHDP